MIYYKVTCHDGEVYHAGWGAWSRPRLVDGLWKPGKPWSEYQEPIEGPLYACQNGLHICTADQLREWIGPMIWVVKPLGTELKKKRDKMVVRDAQLLYPVACWNRRDLLTWVDTQLDTTKFSGTTRYYLEDLRNLLKSSRSKKISTEMADLVESALWSRSLRPRFADWITKHSKRPRRREVAHG